jgi:hypothetical protein
MDKGDHGQQKNYNKKRSGFIHDVFSSVFCAIIIIVSALRQITRRHPATVWLILVAKLMQRQEAKYFFQPSGFKTLQAGCFPE